MNPAKQLQFDISYLRMATVWAQNSYCTRKKVGALLVKDGAIISDGLNGAPSGDINTCEGLDGETLWKTIHAEFNVLAKAAKRGTSTDKSTLYITLSPCRDCSKLILQCGVSRVVFVKAHSDQSGVEFLRDRGVSVEQIDLEQIK